MCSLRSLAALRTAAVVLGAAALLALAAAVLWPRTGPVSANPLTGITAISAGSSHTCAVTTAGGVKCWGSNGTGQLGDGTTTSRLTPVDVVGLTSGVQDVAADFDHSCALTNAGAVKCWGGNGYGQLGDGTLIQSSSPVDVVGLGTGVAAITAGETHTCALTAAGGVKCWGSGEFGQIGDGTFATRASPVSVAGLTSAAIAVAAGNLHTCAIAAGGSVKCWGDNADGQVGDGTFTDRASPVEVVGLSNATAVAAGRNHSCALIASGAVRCWGVGFGTTPVSVSGLTSGVATVSAGEFYFCVMTTAGGVKCRGENDYGQLGDGQSCGVSQCNVPVDVVGLSTGVAVLSAGFRHACVVTDGGVAKCWGWNVYGQLGDGGTTNRAIPADVVVLTIKPTATSTPCPTAGCPTPTATSTPPPQTGVDFSVGIDTDGDGDKDCSTAGGPLNCFISSGQRFTLNVRLNSLPVGGPAYENFDILVTYAGVSSKDNASANSWPECALTGRLFSPGLVRWGCSTGTGASTYVGLVATNDFNCTGAGSITLVHGITDTVLNGLYHEGQGATETLTINCPTPTPRPALGGVAAYPDLPSGASGALLAGVAAAAVACVLALGGAAWYGRRRSL